MKKVKYTDKDGNIGEVSADELKFRPSVYGILIKDDKILLSKQWDGYDFPGGGIDLGETMDEALEREYWEETGLKVKRQEVVSCESSFYYSDKRGYMHSTLIYYLCEKVGGELNLDNIAESEREYIDMPEWIDLKDIENIKFYNSIDSVEIINKAIRILENKK